MRGFNRSYASFHVYWFMFKMNIYDEFTLGLSRVYAKFTQVYARFTQSLRMSYAWITQSLCMFTQSLRKGH
jgi:hypothetical protein